ncbi:MAG: hypothetical protein KC457_29290 [Myxococcales bacterium]|nr:hypothetical protein [Myxococcales bacterium]
MGLALDEISEDMIAELLELVSDLVWLANDLGSEGRQESEETVDIDFMAIYARERGVSETVARRDLMRIYDETVGSLQACIKRMLDVSAAADVQDLIDVCCANVDGNLVSMKLLEDRYPYTSALGTLARVSWKRI